jgi:hypothetical protein
LGDSVKDNDGGPWSLITYQRGQWDWSPAPPERTYTVCKIWDVFTAVTMKNSVLWDVTPRGSCKNRRLGLYFIVACFDC